MSIVTRNGDVGMTLLMYGRQVSKTHPRIEACGAVDELNAALGVAHASVHHDFVRNNLLIIQKDLVVLMGELSVQAEDLARYVKEGYALVTPPMTVTLDTLVEDIEKQNVVPKGWAMPGATFPGATLDLARTICRRAERCVCALNNSGDLKNAEILIYLNRLSDLLWLFARWLEAREKAG
jgi:cob(I)alamin adenosyltransferase